MKKELNKLILTFGLIVALIGIACFELRIDNVPFISNNVKLAKSWDLTGSPILIDDTDLSMDWAYTASNYDWCSGAGTSMDPYVIENVTIDGELAGSCIEIRNSNAYFIIRNCTLYNAYGLSLMYQEAGIKLDSVTNGKLLNNNCSFNFCNGIYLFYSDNNEISGNILSNNRNGIYIAWSNNNDILDNIIKNNREYGIYLDWANTITLSGNNMTNCGLGLDGDISFTSSHFIDTSNTVNEKPLYYYKNTVGLLAGDFINAGQIMLANCDNAIIENVDVSNGSCGIALYSSEGCTIQFINSSHNSVTGIYLDNSNFNDIFDNNVHYNGYGSFFSSGGIVLSDSTNLNINFNIVNFNTNGFSTWGGGPINFFNNTANYNTRSGFFLSTPNVQMDFNRMKECGVEISEHASSNYIHPSNTVNGKPIYWYKAMDGLVPANFSNAGQVILVNSNNSLISNVDVSHGSCGIYFFNCHNNTISYSDASFNTLYGFFSDWLSHNNKITDNSFIDNLYNGIEVIGQNNSISRNTVKCNKLNIYSQAGISILGDNNNITENEVSRYYDFGISIIGRNNKISENRIDNNYMGILISENYNLITNNEILNNRDSGIIIYYCSNNIFTGNLIQNNTLYGIYIYDENCVNNLLYNNKFIFNGIHAIDNSTLNDNQWDNGSIGNYWDDYSGVDADDDGIGDTPYTIPGTAGTQDKFPIWDDGAEKNGEKKIPGYNMFLAIAFMVIIMTLISTKTLKKLLKSYK